MNKLIQYCVMAAVGVLLFASLLVPLTNEAVATTDTFDNTQFAYYQMKPLEVGDTWARSGTTWTYDGVELTHADSNEVSIVATNNMVIRQSGQMRGQYADNNAHDVEVVTVDDALCLQINNYTRTYTVGYGATPNGDYILKTYTDGAYVNEETPIWVSGVTYLTSDSSSVVGCYITGTIKDGFEITAYAGQGSTVTDITVSDYTVNYTPVSGYIDLYQITSIEFDISGTFDGDTVTKAATYSTFVLPKEITAEKAVHADDSTRAIIGVIPIIVIVGLVAGIVGVIAIRRNA